MNWRFRKADGTIVFDVQRYVNDWLVSYPFGEIHIGCDSKRRGARVKYSVSICMREIGRGVHEIFASKVVSGIDDNFTRLWEEVNMAVELAKELDVVKQKIHVHIDLNEDPQYFSNKLYEASMGFIKSLGYQGVAKPYAWAATHGAHQHCQ